jgi:hypothetical protein
LIFSLTVALLGCLSGILGAGGLHTAEVYFSQLWELGRVPEYGTLK